MNRLLILVLLLLLPATLSAQTHPQEAPPFDPIDVVPTLWYTSRAGVIAATMLVVAILKRLLATVRYANQVPTWVYAAVVAGTLTLVLHRVFHTLPGDDFGELVWYAITTAATAGGFHQWFYGGLANGDLTKPLAASTAARERLVNK